MKTNQLKIYQKLSDTVSGIYSITTFKLLFFIIANKDEAKEYIDSSKISYTAFNDYLLNNCGKKYQITQRTYTNCIKDLVNIGVLHKVQRGFYNINNDLLV